MGPSEVRRIKFTCDGPTFEVPPNLTYAAYCAWVIRMHEQYGPKRAVDPKLKFGEVPNE